LQQVNHHVMNRWN